ncbi:hypothetical protein IW140_003548 [Coemansia sp. RSA 1813]|nr:hypothetical protein EV178_003485 [Coemansia sp. RSA 1646]KAJ1769153.1 hypothetical protein LPJ74_004269 [Coemansia sp. RSA 1843]KAJ2089142.1 hypothetical protein IW138_003722 [Coemansia sp. RSA 986]KAJ2215601.1 hypothetical protein EV179_002012 [Coemansia sp. RSA 487]KAJ2568791.1 hypothetical protein IW140_003548 [Coemansia sp. RSA 1813]
MGESGADNVQSITTLNCLELRTHPQRGRGVFTREPIPRGTLVNVSPTLIFGADEYNKHGKFTQLDHYTYCWSSGSFALALGLGSMFNHESAGHQNVGFVRDIQNSLIKYSTLRDIAAGEELCICYGESVWFDVVTDSNNKHKSIGTEQRPKEAKESDDEDFLRSFDL